MVVYGVCGLDDVTFVGDVHGLAFLWVPALLNNGGECDGVAADPGVQQ